MEPEIIFEVAGLPVGQMNFDDAFTALPFDGSWCRPRIVDPDNTRRLVVEFGREFRECVVYNPPHRQAVCITADLVPQRV